MKCYVNRQNNRLANLQINALETSNRLQVSIILHDLVLIKNNAYHFRLYMLISLSLRTSTYACNCDLYLRV